MVPPVKVFLSATSLLPSYGGPAYSVSQLAEALAAQGVCVGLWSADQSAATTELLVADSPVQCLTGTLDHALESFGQPDVIHDNGVWLPHNHRLAALAGAQRIPRIISTRGMLEPWAMSHKRWKKAFAWRTYQERDLRRAARLHATAEPEAANLDRLKLGAPICTIPNGIGVAPSRPATKSIAGRPRIALFLGRIYPVKGLPMLVEAWGRTRPAAWELQIAGPDEAGHRREVERAVEAAGLQSVVSFLGSLDGPAKAEALLSAELLVLPSHSESFGMAAAEGLAHGLPVLTTTAVPWPELFQRGCGWRVEPTVDAFSEGLRRATACSPAALRDMGDRGRAWMAADLGWAPIAGRFADLYELVARGYANARSVPLVKAS